MKVKLLISIIWGALLMAGLPLGAADYFNPADYQYNMTITGTFLIDTVEISAEDTLFAYSGEQCRGFISPKFETDAGSWYAYLVVYGNGSSEQIEFKYLDETTGILVELKNFVVFEIDKILGNPGDPYVFTDRALSVKDGVKKDEVILRLFAETLEIDLQSPMSLEIISLNGKVIYNRNLPGGRTEISMNGLQGNICILRLYNQHNVFTRKIKF